jgi:hypothetical protein
MVENDVEMASHSHADDRFIAERRDYAGKGSDLGYLDRAHLVRGRYARSIGEYPSKMAVGWKPTRDQLSRYGHIAVETRIQQRFEIRLFETQIEMDS